MKFWLYIKARYFEARATRARREARKALCRHRFFRARFAETFQHLKAKVGAE